MNKYKIAVTIDKQYHQVTIGTDNEDEALEKSINIFQKSRSFINAQILK